MTDDVRVIIEPPMEVKVVLSDTVLPGADGRRAYRGTWDAGTSYLAGEWVFYSGSLWFATQDTTDTPSQVSDWLRIGGLAAQIWVGPTPPDPAEYPLWLDLS